jgi:hypothetical protein
MTANAWASSEALPHRGRLLSPAAQLSRVSYLSEVSPITIYVITLITFPPVLGKRMITLPSTMITLPPSSPATGATCPATPHRSSKCPKRQKRQKRHYFPFGWPSWPPSGRYWVNAWPPCSPPWPPWPPCPSRDRHDHPGAGAQQLAPDDWRFRSPPLKRGPEPSDPGPPCRAAIANPIEATCLGHGSNCRATPVLCSQHNGTCAM